MKNVTLTIYKFSELSEKAKQKAIETYRNNSHPYHWEDKNRESLKKFITIFDCSFSGRRYSDSIEYNGSGHELTGLRLRTYLINNFGETLFKRKYLGHIKHHVKHRMARNKTAQHTKNEYAQIYSNTQVEMDCNLTGYCMDYVLLKPLWDFIKTPNNSTMQDLMDEALSAFQDAVEKEIEYQNSDECISETLEANEYEFTEDGEIW